LPPYLAYYSRISLTMLEVKWAYSGQKFCRLNAFIVNIARLEEQDTMRVFRILFDYIQAYPRHAYKYLVKRQFRLYYS
jgi:hypothetical protein